MNERYNHPAVTMNKAKHRLLNTVRSSDFYKYDLPLSAPSKKLKLSEAAVVRLAVEQLKLTRNV